MPIAQCPDCGQAVSTIAISCPTCGHPFVGRARPKLPALATFTCVVVILASFGAAAEVVRQNLVGTLTPYGKLESMAYTNAAAAHVTLTNTTTTTRYSCFRGVVKAVNGRSAPVYSVPVCSGDLKPHCTVALEAAYDPGAVEKICSGPPNTYGMRSIDWDLCTFDLEVVQAF